MRKFIIYVLVLSLLAFTVGALEYRNGDSLDFKLSCDDAGSPCSPTTECNLSVFYPNSSVMIKDSAMTVQGSYVNHSILDTSVNGKYMYVAVCCDGSDCDTSSSYYLIRPSGNLETTPLVMVIALGIIAFLLVYISSGLDKSHWLLQFILPYFALFISIILIPASLLSDSTVLNLLKYNHWIWVLMLAYPLIYLTFYYLYEKLRGIIITKK